MKGGRRSSYEDHFFGTIQGRIYRTEEFKEIAGMVQSIGHV